MDTTKIGTRDVPIKPGHKTIVVFSAGRHGAAIDESGAWEFWSAVLPGGGSVFARCRPNTDPGERFRRMEGKKGYERYWALALKAEYLRPATREEAEDWLTGHRGDAQHAETAEVEGRATRIVEKAGRYIFE